MNMTLGTQLSAADQAYALNAFSYRMTHETVKQFPQQAKCMYEGGFRMTLISDAQWLASTRFATTKTGKLLRSAKWCEHDAYQHRTVMEP